MAPRRFFLVDPKGAEHKKGVEAHAYLPYRKGAWFAPPLPLLVVFSTEAPALYAVKELEEFFNARLDMEEAELRKAVETWKDLDGIAQRIEEMMKASGRPDGFFIDVQKGQKTGVFCDANEAFEVMGDTKKTYLKAFAFLRLADVIRSSIGNYENPKNALYEYCPNKQWDKAADVKKWITKKVVHSPDVHRWLLEFGRLKTSGRRYREEEIPESTEMDRLQRLHEDLLAMESGYEWASRYMLVHGFVENKEECRAVTMEYEISDDLEEFTMRMLKRQAEQKKWREAKGSLFSPHQPNVKELKFLWELLTDIEI
ncbi:hypothetical protein V5O48_006570 [Marasmius crinis-equi]|uniref:Uncharacterized protein n=1 Tax=Marasmius crinis-equi TaxID=585013 RepID=A0ABR3FJQ3_9AGAR